MEILLALIVLFIIGFAIYLSLPSTKLSQASKQLECGNILKAISICESIFLKHEDAPAKMAECVYMQGMSIVASNQKKAISFFNQVIELKKRVPPKTSKEKYHIIEAKAYYAICDFKYKKVINEISSNSKIYSIKKDIEFIETATKTGIETAFTELAGKYFREEAKTYYEIFNNELTKILKTNLPKDDLTVGNIENNIRLLETNIQNIGMISSKVGLEKEFENLVREHKAALAEIYFSYGKKEEKLKNIPSAKERYKKALSYALSSDNKEMITLVQIRNSFCVLKEGGMITSSTLEVMKTASEELQTDFFYRYAIMLMKEKNYSQAEKIMTKKLNMYSSATIKLKDVILAKRSNDALNIVKEINTNLEKLNKNALSTNELEIWYSTLDNHILVTKPIAPVVSNKIKELKPNIFKRLYSIYLVEEDYNKAMDIILKYGKFWENPVMLKNLAICSFNILKNGQMNLNNFEIIISSWLTAAYSDNIIICSLEDTTWDDKFTFSLIDSIGSSATSRQDLPLNVNYLDLSESNVSIGKTQKELLNSFEEILIKNFNIDNKHKIILDFYYRENEHISNLISLIKKDVLFSTPYFAIQNKLSELLLEELNALFEKSRNEFILETATAYIAKPGKSELHLYADTKKTIELLLSSIQSDNIQEVCSLVNEKLFNSLKKFRTLSQETENKIYDSFSRKIQYNSDNESLVQLIIYCINLIPKSEKLKYLFTKFILDLVVSLVNSNKLPNFNALEYLIEAFRVSPENNRLAESIATMVEFNLLDVIYNRIKKKPVLKLKNKICLHCFEIFGKSLNDLLISTDFDSRMLQLLSVNKTASISSNHSAIFQLIEQSDLLKSNLIKQSCKSFKKTKLDLEKQLGAETIAIIRSGNNLTSDGLAIKKAFEIMSQLITT